MVLVEKYSSLGGVCLNVSCIPSKALLHVAKVLDDAKYEGTVQKVTQDTINPPQPEMGGEAPMEEGAEETD